MSVLAYLPNIRGISFFHTSRRSKTSNFRTPDDTIEHPIPAGQPPSDGSSTTANASAQAAPETPEETSSRISRPSTKPLLLTGGCLLALIIAAPVFVIAASPLLGGDGTWAHLRETVLGLYIRNSLFLAFGAGLGAGLIGLFSAWCITMYQFPGRRILEWMLLLPLAMPTYLIAYAYTDFLDFNGPIQDWIRNWTGLGAREYWFPQIRSLGGAIFLFAFVLYPYVYLLCRASFLEQSVCMLDASRTMGQSRLQSFRRVAIPLARPALAAGIALVAMESLADYGAVDYFAVDTFTTGIYRTWFGLGSPIAAAQLSAGLLGVIVLVVVLERLSRGRKRFFHTTNRHQNLPRWPLSIPKKFCAFIICFLPVLIGFLIPLGILIEASTQAGFFPSLLDSLEWAWHSIVLALSASVLAVLFALILSYNVRLAPGLVSRSAARMASLGYAIPGSVIAVGVLLILGWTDRATTSLFSHHFLLSGTLAALLFAYVTRFLTLSLGTVESGLGRISPSLDQAGRTLGAGPVGVLRRIHFPMLRASTLAAALLVFVEVLKELPATLMIRPFNFDTLAVHIYQQASDERFAESAAPALMIVLVGLAPVLILSRMMSKSRAERSEVE
ncbi:ABC transporter permease [Puniceicoccus vermicola]|uniref:ABC transporter permease n=1 Tax=Puniceicoccus vermicola TaxID=388746 RepID=UPI001C8B6701